ncbi:sporulation protein YunB [Limnochorda pilosa]|uniref:Sporulation protein YunB n=1 Tax=Limnochorda pilosa TaxID=1555112 RepID=A0A0K2SMJ1_LIMPI|nr:sporulation protein YunB [Limnochorda pilosa]BAS28325.1 sporulation protein YunB [Limnochorda pilosa]
MEGGGGGPPRAPAGFRARAVLSLFVTALVLGGVIASWLVDRQLRGPIQAWSRSVVENLATGAVASAVRDHLASSISAARLSRPLYDAGGRLQGITYETGEINRIASEATLRIQEALQASTSARLPMPVGQVLGLDFLAALGPRLEVRVIPVGSVEAAPRAEFRQAGINQTLHRILLHVTLRMEVVVPFFPERVTVETEVPIAEQVVVGQVPLVYLNWSGDPLTLPGDGLRWGDPQKEAP